MHGRYDIKRDPLYCITTSMARAPGSSAVYLTSKAFPPEYEDVYCPRSQSSKQSVQAERVLASGSDRRQRMMNDQYRDYSGIGLLRVEFNGTCSMGTAKWFDSENCLLTCAHNVVEYDGTTKKFVYPTSAWFEIRNNQLPSGSTLTKRYQVTKIAVYPPYFGDPTSTSGFDLALCWIDVPKGDRTLESFFVRPMSGYYGSVSAISVVGFPGEYKGEKWGMEANVPEDKSEDWSFPEYWKESKKEEILVYDFVDTSPGQSGSGVIVENFLILGVHTGGSASLKKNWGTYITPTKLRWMADTMGSSWKIATEYDTLYIDQY